MPKFRNSIFLEREAILFPDGNIIFAGENEFKPVFLVRNHLKFLCPTCSRAAEGHNFEVDFSIWDGNTYLFTTILLFKWSYVFYWKINPKFYPII